MPSAQRGEEAPDRRRARHLELFSGLTGFADSFWTLFLCRVGVGEATLGPAAFSLLFHRLGRGARMTFSAGAALLSVPLWLGLLFSDQVGMLVFLNVLLFALALMWVAPATADLHEIAGPHLPTCSASPPIPSRCGSPS